MNAARIVPCGSGSKAEIGRRDAEQGSAGVE
jgi:hypothetical protein